MKSREKVVGGKKNSRSAEQVNSTRCSTCQIVKLQIVKTSKCFSRVILGVFFFFAACSVSFFSLVFLFSFWALLPQR